MSGLPASLFSVGFGICFLVPETCVSTASLCLLISTYRVAALGETNKMLVPNIAIVFGPTLLRKEIETANIAMEMVFRNSIIEVMLRQYDSLFS